MLSTERFEEIRSAVEKKLDRERYIHTLGVACTAEALAVRWGEEPGRAYLAGLLHDCEKCVPRGQRIPLCEERGIRVTETERKNTSLLHAKLGAWAAENCYGVTDPEVISAIRFHTTGRPAMSLLGKILFVADYIEPNRDRAPGLKELRRLAFTDLDRTVGEIACQTAAYLRSVSAEAVDPMTEETMRYYKKVSGTAPENEE